MKVAHSSTTSTDTLPVRIPGASGHLPHIPTAPARPAPVTRAMLDREIAADASENDKWLPGIPGQRRSPEQKPAPVPGQRQSAYDDIVLRIGEPAAWGAF